MARSAVLLAGALLLVLAPALLAQEAPPAQPAASPVREVRIIGARDLSEADARAATNVAIGEPLAGSPETVAEAVARHYHDAGYTFARVSAAFDAPTGTLTLTIDEGVIDGVEFEGIDDRIARTFAEDFALRSGDVFNRNRAREALDALLRPTRGAVRPGRAVEVRATTNADADGSAAAIRRASISSSGTVSASSWSDFASRADDSSWCPISATAKTGSPRSMASSRRSGSAPPFSITIISITPTLPVICRSRPPRTASGMRSASSGRSSARRSSISVASCTT